MLPRTSIRRDQPADDARQRHRRHHHTRRNSSVENRRGNHGNDVPHTNDSSREETPLSYGTFRDHQSTQEREHFPAAETTTDDLENDLDGTGNETVAVLTRRLRCLFTIITWPIVPLGTLAVLALIWFFYAALLDINKPCSHPLKAYALATLSWVLYIPSHTVIRAYLFSYIRERDGPNRPSMVRRYDQIVHTLALLYVYAGITLVQTCRDDANAQHLTVVEDIEIKADTELDGLNASTTDSGDDEIESDIFVNTCDSTCPNLFPALALYVTTLEIFTLSLILPLLCLPCIYLWFLRQVTADQEALAILQERFREEEEALLSGAATVTTGEILNQLEPVKLVKRGDASNSGEEDQIWLVPENATSLAQARDASGAKECCICMNEFYIHDDDSLHPSDIERAKESNNVVDASEEAIVRTKSCGHLFHKRCMASWVGGRWQGRPNAEDDSSFRRRRAKRTSCPLCRSELQTTGN